MALIVKDRVLESCSTSGLVDFTLTGAVSGYQRFSAIGNGNTTYYTAYVIGGTDWEVGIGTVGTSSLSRDIVLSSSTGSKINFNSSPVVWCDLPSSKAIFADANGNVSANSFLGGFTSVTASASLITLTASSTPNYVLIGSGGQTIKLPDATTLPNGYVFTFDNNQSSGAITVNNNSNTLVLSVPSGGYVYLRLLSNAIAAGSWDRHDLSPSNVSWSTNTFDYPGSITSATWNGSTVAVNRGGTGATTLTGYVKGSGTSALTASSTIPTTDLSGTITNAQLTNSAITINGTNTSLGGSISVGTVTSVTGTAPIVSSGGANPAISMPAATTSVNGYLTSTDWNTFNNKGLGSVTSVSATVPSFLSVTGSPITTSGTLTISYSGTALPVANGGTGQTNAFVAGGIVYGSSTNALGVTAVGTTGQILLSNGTSAPTWGNGVVNWQSVQTANFTAVANNAYPINTTSSAITVTLPASPIVGQLITLLDYAGTAATNNILINPNGNKIQGNTAIVVLFIKRQSINLVYVDSMQGWVSYSDQGLALNYGYSANYLIVAGGGGGSLGGSGGGGAGGLLTGSTLLTNGAIYSIIVGAGGAATNPSPSGFSGSNSTISALSLTSIGGGGGGNASAGKNGGSGGGGSNNGSGTGLAGGSGTSGQGNAGGFGIGTSPYCGGGGGGAGAVGTNGVGSVAGSGGIGISSSITGVATYYAGGGGGGGYGTGTGGSGGLGGGGNGTISLNSVPATAGTVNTGGGGGSGGPGAAGGSGVVILSVPTANYTGLISGSPTVTTNGGNTIMTFTSSGSYTA